MTHANRCPFRALLLLGALWAIGWTVPRLATASLPVPEAGRQGTSLRVMTFNIRYGTAEDGENAWPKRRVLLMETIRTNAPDVLGLQEALRSQLDEIGATFGQYGEIGVGRDDGKQAGEYAAILYDKGRLEATESGTFWLSDTPEVPGSASWGNHVTRIVTWAHFKDRVGGRPFYVFNTHWDHESQPSRERSAALLRERIRTRGVGADPVLVMGDFNVGEDNPAFQALMGDSTDAAPGDSTPGGAMPLRDTFRMIYPGAREIGTYHAFTGDRSGEKIDAILVSPGWKVLAAEIVHARRDGHYPSDHFPVRTTVDLVP